MIIVACVEAVALVAVVVLLLRHFAAQQARDMQERRELLTRIQHPELIPTDVPARFQEPEFEPDESNLVGTIHIDENYVGE